MKRKYLEWIPWLILDGTLVFFSFLLAYLLRFSVYLSVFFAHKTFGDPALYLKLSIQASVIWMLIFKCLGVYSGKRFPSFIADFQQILEGSFWGILFLAGSVYLNREFSYSRFVICLGGFCSLVLLALARLLKRYLKKAGILSDIPKKVLMIGSGKNGEVVLKRLSRSAGWNSRAAGFLDDDPANLGKTIGGVKVVGRINELSDRISTGNINEVIVTLDNGECHKIKNILAACRERSVGFLMLPDIEDPLFGNAGIETLHGLPFFGLKKSLLKRPGGIFLKRCADIMLALVMVAVLSPFIAAAAAVIKLTSPGPVFFRQKRIGYNNRIFDIFKFRTMRQDCGGPSWTAKDDNRCTWFGRLLRRTNLDELPQLFNVITGDMSLIGPRPLAVNDMEFQKFPYFSLRHEVKPGLTGWAQINGLRGGNIEPEERIRYDLYYIDNWSVWLDLTILLMTPFALINAF